MSDPYRIDLRADTPPERHNRRLGLVLFLVYLIFYGTFVALTAIDYQIMGRIVFSGLNLAIVYGMALIIGAFLLALVYMALAKNDPTTIFPDALKEPRTK